MARLPISWPPLTGDVRQWWPGKRWWQKPGPWCRTKARLGRRGAMLLSLGFIYVMVGYADLTRPRPTIEDAYHLAIDPQVRGALWAFTGLLAMLYAFVGHRRDAPWWWTDAVGWVALYLLPSVRVTSYGGSWLLWLGSGGAAGDSSAWYLAVLHIPFILIVLICSGWLENPKGQC